MVLDKSSNQTPEKQVRRGDPNPILRHHVNFFIKCHLSSSYGRELALQVAE